VTFQNGASLASAATDCEARKIGTGKHQSSSPHKPQTQVAIRATLIGSDTCTALGMTIRAASPVLGMCRRLVKAGYDPDRRLDCYRGSILAITVTGIGKGAALEVNSHATAFVVFRGRRVASPVRKLAPVRSGVGGAPIR
jgi:hypothetical protein